MWAPESVLLHIVEYLGSPPWRALSLLALCGVTPKGVLSYGKGCVAAGNAVLSTAHSSVSSLHLSLAVVIWVLRAPSEFEIQIWTGTFKVSRLVKTVPTMLQAVRRTLLPCYRLK